MANTNSVNTIEFTSTYDWLGKPLESQAPHSISSYVRLFLVCLKIPVHAYPIQAKLVVAFD